MRFGLFHTALLSIGLFVQTTAGANGGDLPWSNCMVDTANRYGVSSRLVAAIIAAESGNNPKAIHVNRHPDGSHSEDLGLMQVNSWWLPRIEALGYDRDSLFEPCVNIEVGVWILAQEVQHYGYTWTAVGAYNAGRAPDRQLRRARYARRVFEHLEP